VSELLGFFIDVFSVIVGFWPVMFLAALQGIPNRKRKQKFWQWIGKIFRNLAITWILFALMWLGILFFGKQPVFLISEPQNSLLFWGIGGIVLFLWVLSLGFAWLKRRIEFEKMREMGAIQELSPDAFEELVAETFRRLGHHVKVVGTSGDHGVDVRVRASNGEKWVVQCKRYKGTVGEPTVRDLYGTMLHEKAQRASIVTSGRFSRQAVVWAEGKPIDLYDGEAFLRILRKLQTK